MTVELYPAIDLRAGRVVRLSQGDYDAETVYGDDPGRVAEAFVDAGARWIHVVDLDAARTGEATNRVVVAEIVERVDGRAQVQHGGGVRTVVDAAELADIGVARVVMGSAAVRNPAIVDEVAPVVAVAVGLDHRAGELAVDGWTGASGVGLDAALGRYPAAAAFVVTDISRDGMLGGPDVAGLTGAAATSDVPVIASGGVASIADVEVLASIPGLAGIIAGRALYEGRFTVSEGLAALGSSS